MDAPRLPSRSFGLKFLLVCVLAVLMSLPALLVYMLIYDRTTRAEQVVQEVGVRYGGEQTFTGPMLVAPYRAVRATPVSPGQPPQPPTVEEGWYVVFAETGSTVATVDTNERRRGNLFKVRTYTADLAMEARFDLTREPSAAPQGAVIDWTRAAILIGVGDPRGAQAAEMTIEGIGTVPLNPGSSYPVLNSAQSYDGRGQVAPGQWLAADASAFAAPGRTFNISSTLRFTGVESIGLVPFAKNTTLTVNSDWPHVGYFGAFPLAEGDEVTPATAAAAGQGSSATWSIPFVARGLAAAGTFNEMSAVGQQDVRVRFVDPSNPYQSVTRSLKYALLFLGVVFLFYFLFETTGEQRVHPAQYILVGLAQLVFYLLLLALAERLGFNPAFLIAAGATVLLISFYAGAIFKSRARFLAALGSFTALYALIYMLMSLEDYALLAGSLAAFAAIAAVMWFTRNLDWYGLNGDISQRRIEQPRPPPAANV
jgi:inner membrane protein